jgi:hypothetical protein
MHCTDRLITSVCTINLQTEFLFCLYDLISVLTKLSDCLLRVIGIHSSVTLQHRQGLLTTEPHEGNEIDARP